MGRINTNDAPQFKSEKLKQSKEVRQEKIHETLSMF